MNARAEVVLVHGYTGSPEDLAPLAGALAPRVAITQVALPGHEDRQKAPPFDAGAFVARIAAAVNGARARGRETVLVAHSTGASLALAGLQDGAFAPPALLVLIGAPRRIDMGYRSRWQRASAGRDPPPLPALAALISLVNRAGVRRVPGQFPVLVLHGAEDELVPAADASNWEVAFHGPARTVLVLGAGHNPFAGPRARLAADVVARAIADVLESGGPGQREALARLCEIEPEARAFFAPRPLSARHLLRSPAGRRALGLDYSFLETAPTEPLFVNVEITTHCGLRCRYCARTRLRRDARHMPADTFRRVLEQLPHAYRITFVGLGEPLLNPEVADLVRLAAREGRRVGLVTNAMHLERPLAERLIDAGLASIAFSLDCPNQALTDELRPGTDLPRVLDHIAGFVELAASNRTVAKAVFSAVSYASLPFLGELIDLVRGLGVDVLMLSDLNFAWNVADSLSKNVDAPAANELREAVRRAFSAGLPVLSVRALEELGLAARYSDFLLLPPGQLMQRAPRHAVCASPWQTLPVGADGTATVCDCQPERVIGDLLAEPLCDIWNGPAMREQRRAMTSDAPPAACLVCPRF